MKSFAKQENLFKNQNDVKNICSSQRRKNCSLQMYHQEANIFVHIYRYFVCIS